jgi:uncharacterized membrane protein
MDDRIVVFGFDREFGAEGALIDIEKMVEEGLLVIEDAVTASCNIAGQIQIKQGRPKSNKSAKAGAGVGFLAGMLLGGPILGAAVGAGIGKIMGSLKDYGLDDKFIGSISASLQPQSSALFLLVVEAKADEIKERLKHLEARVLTTNLPPEKEKELRKLVEG